MYDRLTRKDIEKMEQEIEHRKLVVRKQAIEDVKEARAQNSTTLELQLLEMVIAVSCVCV